MVLAFINHACEPFLQYQYTTKRNHHYQCTKCGRLLKKFTRMRGRNGVWFQYMLSGEIKK